MLVQPTSVVTGSGISGHDVNPSTAPALSELANLRDRLAADEVTATEAASCLTARLATQSTSRARTRASAARKTADGRIVYVNGHTWPKL